MEISQEPEVSTSGLSLTTSSARRVVRPNAITENDIVALKQVNSTCWHMGNEKMDDRRNGCRCQKYRYVKALGLAGRTLPHINALKVVKRAGLDAGTEICEGVSSQCCQKGLK